MCCKCAYSALQAFPEKDCFKMPIILIAVVGAVMLLISAVISFLQSVAATELDPDSRDILALAHARCGPTRDCALLLPWDCLHQHMC